MTALREWGASVGRGLLDLVFAPVCALCDVPVHPAGAEALVCPGCASRLRPIPAPRCERCWTPVPASSVAPGACRVCPTLPPAIRAVRSAATLDETSRRLVHALKYRGWSELGAFVARRIAALPLPPDVGEEARWVLPVPVTPARLRERGYNQAAAIARPLAHRKGLRLREDLLVRTRSNGTQTTLHPGERRANVAGAFAVPDGACAALRHEHVVLVDDVWTTGATAESCAAALTAAGARAVTVVTFARVFPELERS